MPGFYQPGDYELVGFIVGLVDRPKLLDGSRVRPGDVLVGLPSAGLHTNGYSLARRILFETMKLGLSDRIPDITGRERVGEWLLRPHLSYLSPLRGLIGHPAVHALAHITGGGLTDNLPRVLPAETRAVIKPGSWEIPQIYEVLRQRGEVEIEEMFRVFNMGIGMVVFVDPHGLREVLSSLRASGQPTHLIGTVQSGGSGVVYDFGMIDGEG